MPGKKAKSSTSARSSAGAGVSPSTTKCAVCDQNIVDGKDQALFCEGLCKGWFHRYCAGVSLAHFDFLSTSAHPFHCVACFQKSYYNELADLKNTVCVLRAEITQLREDLARKDCTPTPESSYSAVAANKVLEVREQGGQKHHGRRFICKSWLFLFWVFQRDFPTGFFTSGFSLENVGQHSLKFILTMPPAHPHSPTRILKTLRKRTPLLGETKVLLNNASSLPNNGAFRPHTAPSLEDPRAQHA